jgi:hypothetical protein
VAEVKTEDGFTVKEKGVGPALPAAFMAVTMRVLVAAAVGVPLNRPADDTIKPDGTPVADQVTGGVPVAANWKE